MFISVLMSLLSTAKKTGCAFSLSHEQEQILSCVTLNGRATTFIPPFLSGKTFPDNQPPKGTTVTLAANYDTEEHSDIV